jgi:hypothetical protein
LSNVAEFSGSGEREYLALTLPGRFYDPSGQGPSSAPHLEVPARTLASPDPDFPERIALMGNGLLFPWWVPNEVTAAKRSLFAHPGGRIDRLAEMFDAQRPALVAAAAELVATLAPQWSTVEGLLASSPDGLSAEATGNVSESELLELFPAGRLFHLEAQFETKLREKSGSWASRRVGVWQLGGVDADGERFSIGVLTPRLTASSLFKDPLFAVEDESPAALLVRCAVMSRLVRVHLRAETSPVRPVESAQEGSSSFFRTVPARDGQKYPEASMRAAVSFLQSFPSPESAWQALEAWANKSGCLLTTTSEGFAAAWRRASRFLRRAEELDRDDVNVILPLAWDDRHRVVRATFVAREQLPT